MSFTLIWERPTAKMCTKTSKQVCYYCQWNIQSLVIFLYSPYCQQIPLERTLAGILWMSEPKNVMGRRIPIVVEKTKMSVQHLMATRPTVIDILAAKFCRFFFNLNNICDYFTIIKIVAGWIFIQSTDRLIVYILQLWTECPERDEHMLLVLVFSWDLLIIKKVE